MVEGSRAPITSGLKKGGSRALWVTGDRGGGSRLDRNRGLEVGERGGMSRMKGENPDRSVDLDSEGGLSAEIGVDVKLKYRKLFTVTGTVKGNYKCTPRENWPRSAEEIKFPLRVIQFILSHFGKIYRYFY